jgi:hypothetical protein
MSSCVIGLVRAHESSEANSKSSIVSACMRSIMVKWKYTGRVKLDMQVDHFFYHTAPISASLPPGRGSNPGVSPASVK